MSAEARPITPRSFARALKDLSLASLHLKVLEIRNSIAHLRFSNEELRPFAEGRQAPLSNGGTTVDGAEHGSLPSRASQPSAGTDPVPDQDCIDAIRENEVVMERMEERIALIRDEVERRGLPWTAEFMSAEEAEALAARGREVGRAMAANGEGTHDEDEDTDMRVEEDGRQHRRQGEAQIQTQSGARQHPAWSDGTFQTGRIRNGEVTLDGPQQQQQAGARLTDEELRRAVESRMRDLGVDDDPEDEEGGMHL